MHDDSNPRFPDGFLWGGSSSAWQVEGGILEGGRTLSTIDVNSRTKAPFADNSIAVDHYHRFREDVRLMAEGGMTSYRFSISWSRIIPASDGKVNEEGVAFYDALIDELLGNGITPIVTLYHYDMPLWVEDEFGGWKTRAIIEKFGDYGRVCLERFGDRVKHWLSINEQNMQIVYGHWLGTSKGCDDWFRDQWRINHIMNLCHATAVNLCHEIVDGGKIGPVPGLVPIYPYSADPMDQIAAMNAEEFTEKIWTDTYAHGEYSDFVKGYWERNDIDPGIEPGDEELMKSAEIDFFAVNCYRSNTARWAAVDATPQEYELNTHGDESTKLQFPVVPGAYQLVYNEHVRYTDWDWEIDPVSMRYCLRYMWDHYRLPMVITENGFGAHESLGDDGQVHDTYRVEFLRDTIYQIGLAIEDGCDVFGYNLWSFTDFLSTGNGIAKRYGLVYVDVTDEQLNAATDASQLALTRIPKDSYHWYSALVRSNGRNWGPDFVAGSDA